MFRKEKEKERGRRWRREETAIVGTAEGVLDRKVQRPLSSLKEGGFFFGPNESFRPVVFLFDDHVDEPPSAPPPKPRLHPEQVPLGAAAVLEIRLQTRSNHTATSLGSRSRTLRLFYSAWSRSRTGRTLNFLFSRPLKTQPTLQ